MIADTFSTLYLFEKLKRFLARPIGVFIYTIVTEVVGMLILMMFLSTVLAPAALLTVLPVVLALNGAAGGYRLGNREPAVPHWKSVLTASAVLLTLSGCVAVTLFCPWEPVLDLGRCLVYGVTVLVFTFFGFWIARENNKLMKKKA